MSKYEIDPLFILRDQDAMNHFGHAMAAFLIKKAQVALTAAICDEHAELLADRSQWYSESGTEEFIAHLPVSIWRSGKLGHHLSDLTPESVDDAFAEMKAHWNLSLYGHRWLAYFSSRGVPTPNRCPEEIFEDIAPSLKKILTSGLQKVSVGR